MLKTILFILVTLIPSQLLAEGCLIYIPPECRQHNSGPSCGFASITTCLRAANLWEVADGWWSRYRGPANTQNVRSRLTQENIKFKMFFNSDQKGILEALDSGRMVAVTWGSRHMVTLAGVIDGNAYVIDNNRPKTFIVQPLSKFWSMHRVGGGWAVVILSGTPSKPVIQNGLQGYEKSLYVNP